MKHVVIIGAGIVGLCSADALLRRGFRVTVIEKDARPGDGCSFGNGGLIVPSHFEPLASPGMVMTGIRMLRSKESPFGFSGLPGLEMAAWMARFALAGTHAHVERCAPVLRDLNLGSRALYESVYADLVAGYERRGELMVCRTAKALDGEAHLAANADKLGLKTRVLDRAALAAFETGIEYDAMGAVYFEDDGHLTPSLFMPALRKRVQDAGGVIRDVSTVNGFGTAGRQIRSVKIGDEELAADEVVLAAGAYTGQLARKLGLNLPLLAGKGYGFTVANPPATPKYPGILVEGRVAVTPMVDGLRFVGTMELGLPREPQVNPSRLRGMRKAIAEAYPAFRGFEFADDAVWAGLRPCSPDGMPYMGRSKTHENLTIATGHGMMGLSLGPISGELVAQSILGEPTTVPLNLLSPNRFS